MNCDDRPQITAAGTAAQVCRPDIPHGGGLH